jgi:leader peptidase (prepilin peptidase) / N-methyltransferase
VSVAATTTHVWGLLTASVAAAAVGALIGGELVERGLAQLEVTGSTAIKRVGRVTGALGGIAAAVAAWQAGSWWLLPALLVWTCLLAAAATCDAATQRIPTALVRQGAAAVAVLVVLASAAAGQWRWAALAAACAGAAGVILAVCWRVAGAGFGDVRLAVLGGLGLVLQRHLGWVAACVVVAGAGLVLASSSPA